jgi:hypothetical protein
MMPSEGSLKKQILAEEAVDGEISNEGKMKVTLSKISRPKGTMSTMSVQTGFKQSKYHQP